MRHLYCSSLHVSNSVMSYYFVAVKAQPIEFYDFLQVNAESNGSEVIDNARKEDEEVDQEAKGQQNKSGAPFIDFLSVGSSN